MRVVAIDGPAGAGKSTVARRVAVATGLPFLDTGAMYRCVALVAIRRGVQGDDAVAVADIARTIRINVRDGVTTLDGVDVSGDIRTPEVNSLVSVIATNSAVREVMREAQRRWASDLGGGVVEGRDIGTVVFPDAAVKVFLTASVDERARRRHAELVARGERVDLRDIRDDVERRDHADSSRAASPLVVADGATVVDTTGMGVSQVVQRIAGMARGVTA